MNLWGIDLGGTKIEGVVLTGPGGDRSSSHNELNHAINLKAPLWRQRIATGAHLGYDHVIEQVVSLVATMRSDTGLKPERLGVGTPGIYDPLTHLMKNCNTTCLNHKPLKEDLECALGIPVMLANDANCFVLAESRLGAARGEPTVFGAILGTGVGGGLVINGRLLSGAQGIAGEWGHNQLDDQGPQCYCGKRGCLETLISGPALERRYEALSGTKRSLKEVARLAVEGADLNATQTLGYLLRTFGRAIGMIINVLDPHAVVIGGGVGNIDLLYSTDTLATVGEFIFNDCVRTKLLRPALGDSAGVFGAAMLNY